MSRQTRGWLIAAFLLMVAGAVLAVIGFFVFGGGFLNTNNPFHTTTHTISASVSSISVDAKTADVTLLVSANGYGKVECYEQEKVQHTVTVENGTLVIKQVDERKWYEHLSIGFNTPKITVYLPRETYSALHIKGGTGDVTLPSTFAFESVDIQGSTGDVTCEAAVSGAVKIAINTGDIRFAGKTAGSLDLAVSTGHITIDNTACAGNVSARVSTGKATFTSVTCAAFTSVGSTGDLALTDVVASGALTAKRSTGDITFTRCDAAELTVTTDTGDVTGSLRSEKLFFAHSDTGHVDVPEYTTGGKCSVTTDTGRIVLSVG